MKNNYKDGKKYGKTENLVKYNLNFIQPSVDMRGKNSGRSGCAA